MIAILLSVACGALVGLSLALTGGGGSNFAVPLLVFVIGLAPSQAMPLSMAAVAIIAAIGAIHAIRQSLIHWSPTLTFAAGGMLGAPLGLKLAHGVPEQTLLSGFAVLALLVGSSMAWRAWQRPQETAVVRALPDAGHEPEGLVCRAASDGKLRFSAPCSLVLALTGIITGVLAGFFGVGGGFLIVPALMLITRMGIHHAVATSLVVIALTGLTGAAYAMSEGRILWSALTPFVAGGIFAMLAGRQLAARISGPRLQQLFATAIVLMALLMLARSFLHGV